LINSYRFLQREKKIADHIWQYPMKCLSLIQPPAGLLAVREKAIELRKLNR
jgi:hypothetical protein